MTKIEWKDFDRVSCVCVCVCVFIFIIFIFIFIFISNFLGHTFRNPEKLLLLGQLNICTLFPWYPLVLHLLGLILKA